MKKVSVAELKSILESQVGATFVTILAYTKPDFVGGKSCPVANVRKLAAVNGVINWSYEKSVNRQRLREEKPADENGAVEYFTPEPRKWGVRLFDEINRRLLPTVEHKGKTYLELKFQKSLGYSYWENGTKVPNEVVNPHLRQKIEGRRQEVDNPVILRDYTLDNIKAIRLNGELLVIGA
jgi:hypothetical protein